MDFIFLDKTNYMNHKCLAEYIKCIPFALNKIFSVTGHVKDPHVKVFWSTTQFFI